MKLHAVGLGGAAENYTSTFRITLDDGIYVLLSAATWDPTSADKDVGGYVIYNFLVNVTGRQGV